MWGKQERTGPVVKGRKNPADLECFESLRIGGTVLSVVLRYLDQGFGIRCPQAMFRIGPALELQPDPTDHALQGRFAAAVECPFSRYP